MFITEAIVNPRLAIELTILRFDPDISDIDLLNKREEIFLEAYHLTPSGAYVRDYYIYSRKKMV